MLKRKWHGIPTVFMSILLALALTAGIAFAVDYDFFEGDISAQLDEAMVLGLFDTWDNLKPYGSDSSVEWEWEQESWHTGVLGDVTITLGEEPTITIASINGYEGAGFVAGEWIVIPVNLRNGGSGILTLGATVVSSGLEVDYCWLENTGVATETHPDGDLNYAFRDDENWAPLIEWSSTIEGYGGESGSARLGAQVLFVRIRAPGNIEPATHTLDITLTRS